ncbi:hypothetical protein TNCV_1577801 [Trichonephila clavipes]|nr:hypothetical protein TNCV_1577801 [Trichonephila clavipes]
MAANNLQCTFHWTIFNTSAFWLKSINFEDIEANLLLNDGHFTRFHLKLSQDPPGGRNFVCVITYHSNRALLIAKVNCRVLFGTEVLSTHESDNFEFTATSHFEIPLTVPVWPLTHETKILQIECDINPNSGHREAELKNIGEFIRRGLRMLSYDMERLLRDWCIPNLRLVARGGQKSYYVSSFILKRRWPTFYERHNIQDSVLGYMFHTLISPGVLWSILFFVYSARVEYRALKFCRENSELARLVHFYDLLQLHTVYAPLQTNVVQSTLVGVTEQIIEAKLLYETGIDEEHLHSLLFTVDDAPYSQNFRFDIHEENLGSMGRWLSYKIIGPHEVRRPICIGVHISARIGHIHTVLHNMEYDIVITSGVSINRHVLFLGSRETLHGLLENEELNFCIKVFYFNGRASNMVLSLTNINLTDCDLRYNLLRRLSEDMREMHSEGYHAFCEVVSSTTPETERIMQCKAHQPILWTRIPFWQNATRKFYFEPTCRLPVHIRALHEILRYVYTGALQSYSIGNDVLEEIRLCYRDLGFPDLSDYFNEMDRDD